MSTLNLYEFDFGIRHTDEDHRLENFAGRNCQLVVDTNNNYHLNIMDGKTLGGKTALANLNTPNDFTVKFTLPIEPEIENIKNNEVLCKQETQNMINSSTGEFVTIKLVNSISDIDTSNPKHVLYFIKD